MVGAARAGHEGAGPLARLSSAIIAERFIRPGDVLPTHSTRLYRRSIVSFGSVTYFLRAAYELGTAFDDAAWLTRFGTASGGRSITRDLSASGRG